MTVVRKETVEYATFPFSLAVMRTMLPLFLRSYVSLTFLFLAAAYWLRSG